MNALPSKRVREFLLRFITVKKKTRWWSYSSGGVVVNDSAWWGRKMVDGKIAETD